MILLHVGFRNVLITAFVILVVLSGLHGFKINRNIVLLLHVTCSYPNRLNNLNDSDISF